MLSGRVVLSGGGVVHGVPSMGVVLSGGGAVQGWCCQGCCKGLWCCPGVALSGGSCP